MDLTDKIERKFIESFDIDDYEILTDSGWKDCLAIHKTIEYKVWSIETETHQLRCADDHILFDENMEQVFAKDLVPGDFIQTDSGTEEVVDVVQTDDYDNMYDIELDDFSDHRYYTNGILSHNTTTYTIYALWKVLFFPENKIMLLANKADTSIEILSRIQLAYGYIPTWMKPGVVVWNKGEMIFSNKSAIKGFATASDSARGYSAGTVIMDEAAFVPNNIASKVFESIYPVISSSKKSQFIMVSTPNGADSKNLYYEIWQKANSQQKGSNSEGWKAFRFDWWDVPGRDEEWKEKQIASIGQQRFDQEFGNQFLATSTVQKLIPNDIIEKYRIKLSEYKALGVKPKKQKIVSEAQDQLYEFDMWHEFKPNHTYCASADISEGVGQDYSVLQIWDVTDTSNITLCAKFSSNTVSLVQFAYVTNKILRIYGSPFLFAERNGVSSGMLDSLRITYGYQNIAAENKKGEPGIFSHVTVKEKACLFAREMMTTNGIGFTIYDKDLIDEFDIFVRKNNQSNRGIYQAIPGPNSHDDNIMTFIWMTFALHKDRVDTYFQVCQTFTSDLQQIYPKTLMPLAGYTSDQIKAINNDPIYKDFLEFKEQLSEQAKKAYERQKDEDDADIFKYQNSNQIDYFGDDDGPMWGVNSSRSSSLPQSVNPNNRMPQFFVF